MFPSLEQKEGGGVSHRVSPCLELGGGSYQIVCSSHEGVGIIRVWEV